MFLFPIFILIPIINARHNDVPSYRSSVMEGDKPILRMPTSSESESETGYDNMPPSRSPKRQDDKLVNDVSTLIEWLVDNFGYSLSLQGRKNNDVSTNVDIPVAPSTGQQSSLLEITLPGNVQVSSLRAGAKRSKAEKTKHKKKKLAREKGSTKSEPGWVKNLKDYIKDLTTRFKQQDLGKYTNPVIASVEKKHGVKINDIDVDQYGEIYINYVKLNKEKKKE